MSYVAIKGRVDIKGRRNSKCKGPKPGTRLASLREKKMSSEARAE